MSRDSAMRQIHLPDEILELIFYHMRDHSHGEGITALFVCRRWYFIGAPILLIDVALTMQNMRAFTEAFGIYGYVHYTRTLSINVKLTLDDNDIRSEVEKGGQDPIWDLGQAFAAEVNKQIWLLAAQIPRLTNLRSFSFYVSKSGSCGFRMAGSAINKLLQALPLTCSSIEIYGNGYDVPAGHKHTLCKQIHTHLPYLRHLRISVARFCPQAFDNENWDLRPVERERPAVRAPLLQTLQIDCSRETRNCHDVRAGAMTPGAALVTRLRAMLGEGHFPSARRFEVNEEESSHLVLPPGYARRDLSAAAREYLDDATTWVETVEGFRVPADYVGKGSRYIVR